ncbi:hypothetical protein Goari_026312, partial [Gossypium aridum]|nr:hypothetical protein [Gossypium aridum]
MARLQPRTNPHQFSNLQQPLYVLPHCLLAQRIEIDKKKNSSPNSSHPSFESLSRMTFVNLKSSANWSLCSTAVASAITTDRTRLCPLNLEPIIKPSSFLMMKPKTTCFFCNRKSHIDI